MSALPASDAVDVRLEVNGVERALRIEPRETIADVLRDRLGLVGTRMGCELQICGACTVLLDGMPVSACSVLAVDADGRRLETVEGLAGEGGALHPLQQAFLEAGAVQCGFCTPGMLLSAKALLDEIPSPTEEDVRRYLTGNICRCTGYAAIVGAVLRAAPLVERGGGR